MTAILRNINLPMLMCRTIAVCGTIISDGSCYHAHAIENPALHLTAHRLTKCTLLLC